MLAQSPADDVAEYYRQQLEMLEGFNEMDTLTDCGFLPGMSKGDEFHFTKDQEKWVVDIMFSVTLVKFLLVIYCRTFTNEIVKAYAQDHLFYVITNVIELVAALLASYVQVWVYLVGAIIGDEFCLTKRAGNVSCGPYALSDTG